MNKKQNECKNLLHQNSMIRMQKMPTYRQDYVYLWVVVFIIIKYVINYSYMHPLLTNKQRILIPMRNGIVNQYYIDIPYWKKEMTLRRKRD
jgi:hypothetical protein